MSLLELSTHAVRRKVEALNWQTEGFNQNHVGQNHSRPSSSLNDSDLIWFWLPIAQVRVGSGPASASVSDSESQIKTASL